MFYVLARKTRDEKSRRLMTAAESKVIGYEITDSSKPEMIKQISYQPLYMGSLQS